MARIVRLDPGAYADIVRITRYISRRVSPKSAARWHKQIGSAINRLRTEADRWPEAEEAVDLLGINLRVRIHGRGRHVYRILYTIKDETVNVLRVRHAAQDWLTKDDV